MSKTRWREHPLSGWMAILAIAMVGLAGLYYFRDPDKLAILGTSGLVTMGIVGTWRWSWLGFQVVRSRIFQHWVFPRWRRRANAVPTSEYPQMVFVIPTFKEQEWITERVFKAIANEVKTLELPTIILVNSSGDKENQLIEKILKSENLDRNLVELMFMTQKDGKRKAMADALRELAKCKISKNAVVALMDGDSELTPGTLRGCLPFFQIFPKMGALTTDELPIVHGSYFFSEWFHLRMSQRHYQMCSLSLSSKVLCLTGRFSLFRSEAALDPSFADRLEVDTLDDWLWGRFKFLSGDDKSTWYWLLKRGYDMLYIPDVIVYSIETISGSLMKRSYNNMRRWYGNMLRNSDRALALGPGKMGGFIWYCLLDQRVSIWTALITPSLLLLSLIRGQWLVFGILCSWILFSRPLMLFLIFLGRPSYPKPIHLLLLLSAQWSSAAIKVWTQMNLAQQNWANRGNQTISAAGTGWEKFFKVNTSNFLMYSQIVAFIIVILTITGLIHPASDMADLWWRSRQVAAVPARVIEASAYGVIPNDSQDDSSALQALIDRRTDENPIQINLPLGEIDLQSPVKINRSDITLKGIGIDRTILQANFTRDVNETILQILPQEQSKQPIENVHLNGFTLYSLDSESNIQPQQLSSGISIERVNNASLKYLNLEMKTERAIVLQDTQDVTIEYVALDRRPLASTEIVTNNAVNTQVSAVSISGSKS
ncbi:MAG: glycosyltransferase [Geitlerinemataceae cyanobacterium]